MDKIQIIDNFLNDNELLLLNNEINKFKYDYGIKSNDKTFNIYTTGVGSIGDFFFSKMLDNILIDKIYNTISFSTVLKKKYKVNRNYLQIQTYGKNGDYHTDNINLNAYTVCLYITEIEDELLLKCGGNFYLKVPNEKHIISIETNNNRAILFPSHYYHNGMSYNIYTNYTKRICFVWQIEEIV
jgi:hypothetical protein